MAISNLVTTGESHGHRVLIMVMMTRPFSKDKTRDKRDGSLNHGRRTVSTLGGTTTILSLLVSQLTSPRSKEVRPLITSMLINKRD